MPKREQPPLLLVAHLRDRRGHLPVGLVGERRARLREQRLEEARQPQEAQQRHQEEGEGEDGEEQVVRERGGVGEHVVAQEVVHRAARQLAHAHAAQARDRHRLVGEEVGGGSPSSPPSRRRRSASRSCASVRPLAVSPSR